MCHIHIIFFKLRGGRPVSYHTIEAEDIQCIFYCILKAKACHFERNITYTEHDRFKIAVEHQACESKLNLCDFLE